MWLMSDSAAAAFIIVTLALAAIMTRCAPEQVGEKPGSLVPAMVADRIVPSANRSGLAKQLIASKN